MKKTAGLLALMLVCMVLSSCSAPADQPAKNWIAFLDKHKALMEQDKFDAKAFKTEGEPLIAELVKHRDASSKKILMTEPVLAEWKRSNEEFGKACDKYTTAKGDPEAGLVYLQLVEQLTGETE